MPTTAKERFGWASPQDEAYQARYGEDYQHYLDLRETLDNEIIQRINYATFCPEIRSFVAEHPEFPPAKLELARAVMKGCAEDGGRGSAEAFYEAEKLIRAAIEQDPDYADAYVLLGYVLSYKTSFEKAEAALLKAEELGTNNPWLHINFYTLYKNFFQPELGCERIELARKMDIKLVSARDAMLQFATRCVSNDEPVENVIAMHEARIANNPNEAFAYGAYGRYVLGATLDYERARELIHKALSLKNYGMARAYLSASYYTEWFLLKDDAAMQDRAEQAYVNAGLAYPNLRMVLCVLNTGNKTQPVAAAVTAREEAAASECRSK